MRAIELKRKYPELWDGVESQVKMDLRKSGLVKELLEQTAHNAAFVACSYFHRHIKIRAGN